MSCGSRKIIKTWQKVTDTGEEVPPFGKFSAHAHVRNSSTSADKPHPTTDEHQPSEYLTLATD